MVLDLRRPHAVGKPCRMGPSPWCPRHDRGTTDPWHVASSTPRWKPSKHCPVATPSLPEESVVSVSAPVTGAEGSASAAPCRSQLGHAGDCLGPSWRRETAVNSGQPRSPADSRTRSSTAISAVMRPKVRIWHARGHSRISLTGLLALTAVTPRSVAVAIVRPLPAAPSHPRPRAARPRGCRGRPPRGVDG